MELMTQCLLEKDTYFHTAWIPIKFAIKGKYIKIKYNNLWDDGWKVLECYSTMDSKYVQERSEDYKNQRKQSDI